MELFRYVGKRLKDAYKREPNISTEEWASKHVYFSGTDVSPITGAFQVKYSPHLKKLFALVDRPQVHKIFAKWASQSAKSLFELIVAGKKLDTEPTNILYMQPIKDDIPKIVDIKINPLLKCMKRLWRKFEDYKVKESVRGKRELKRLAGGALIISGSSVKERKSLTIAFLLMGEIAEFEEGAVVEAEERTKSFSKFFPKVIGVSTIVHPKDEICTNFDKCEVKIEWHYICPSCKENFYPDFTLFKFPSKTEHMNERGLTEETLIARDYLENAKTNAHVKCPHCEYKINSEEKDEMALNDKMDWFIINPDGTTELLLIENLTTETSFGADMNSLGSYFVPFSILVENLVNAEDDDVKLEKIYRGWFNKFYDRAVVQADDEDMFLLGNSVAEWIVPKDTVKIYLTVDNQVNYFFAQVTAIGYGNVTNLMYFDRVESWNDVEDLWDRCQYLEDEDGENYMASKMMIDRRGYNEGGVSRTDEADAFVDYMTQKWGEDRIYGGEGHPVLTGNKAFTVVNHKDYSNQRNELKVKIVKFSNLYLKNLLFRSIDRTIVKVRAETEEDEGYNYSSKLFYINQDNIDRDVAGVNNLSVTRMLTAEVFDYAKHPKTGKLADIKSWIPIRKRNDAIDTSTMALTLGEMDKIALMRKPSGENLEAALNQLESLDFS